MCESDPMRTTRFSRSGLPRVSLDCKGLSLSHKTVKCARVVLGELQGFPGSAYPELATEIDVLGLRLRGQNDMTPFRNPK